MGTAIINKNLIKFDMACPDKNTVIAELAKLIDQENRLNKLQDYTAEVLHRETLTSTGIGYGIAVPHGKCKAVDVPTVAFGRINHGIEWGSLDGKPVHMVFLLAVPDEAASTDHLKLLAALARKFMDEKFRSSLLTMKDESAVLHLLSSVFDKVLQ